MIFGIAKILAFVVVSERGFSYCVVVVVVVVVVVMGSNPEN